MKRQNPKFPPSRLARTGFIRGLLYYAIGLVAAWLTYIIFGWEYAHGPGLHHIVAVLFLLSGAVWTVYYFILILTGLISKVNFGLFAVHVVMLLTVVLYVVIGIRSEEMSEYKSNPEDIITINRDTATKTASVVNGYGDTVFLMRKDSVLIDRVKSDTAAYR